VFGDERPLESALVYMLYLLPLIAIGILLARGTRGDGSAIAGRIAPVAVVALLVDVSFIRDPLNTRLADAIVPAVILGAWLITRAFSASSRREFTVPLALAFTLLMGASVLTVGFTYEEINRAGLLGRARDIPTRFAERRSSRTLRRLPAHACGAPPRAVFLATLIAALRRTTVCSSPASWWSCLSMRSGYSRPFRNISAPTADPMEPGIHLRPPSAPARAVCHRAE
jgi:hypothetical protein